MKLQQEITKIEQEMTSWFPYTCGMPSLVQAEWPCFAPSEPNSTSAAPRNNTVDIRPNADGTTSLHIDKTQVRLRFGAESEEKVEIVLEPREQT